jgi:hypothetical protein
LFEKPVSRWRKAQPQRQKWEFPNDQKLARVFWKHEALYGQNNRQFWGQLDWYLGLMT